MSKELSVHMDLGDTRRRVGTLLYSEKMNRHVFAYDAEFLRTGYEISPLQMPLSEKTFDAAYEEDFHGLHGVFADSLPDAWGMRVQDVQFEKIGILEPTPLDRLAFVGKYSMGALRYEPRREFEKREEIVEYSDLRKGALQIIEGDVAEVVDELLQCGGSAGGARPKFLVDLNTRKPHQIRYTRGRYEGDYIPVLLKVPVGKDDVWQRVEYVYSMMASKAGLRVPPCYLLQGSSGGLCHFASARFDILPGGERQHMATLAGIVGEPFRMVKHDYGGLLRTTEVVTNDHREVMEAYRRMAFNYLGCNRDDHAKNFSFCMDNAGVWRLSPAYDVGFSKGQMNNNTMAINGKTMNPTVKDFRIVAEEFRIAKWKEILNKTLEVLKQWPALAKEAGIAVKAISRIDTPIRQNTKRIGKDLGIV